MSVELPKTTPTSFFWLRKIAREFDFDLSVSALKEHDSVPTEAEVGLFVFCAGKLAFIVNKR